MHLDRDAYDALPEEDKRAVDKLLAQYAKQLEANPLNRYIPHPKQDEFHLAQTRVKAFFGGNRSGKTTCGILDDLIQAVDASALPARLRAYKRWQPPFYCRIVCPDLNRTLEGVILQKLREWTPRSQLVGDSWDSAYDKQKRILRFKNGSWFDFMTYEMDLDKFMGAALHRIHYDEEPPQDIRQECAARLLDFGGDEVFSMTPLHGMTWLYDDIYERRHLPGISVVQVSMTDNPHISKVAMEEFLAGLTEEEVRARKEGRFVHFGGLVLPEFNDRQHVIKPIRPEHLKGHDVVVGIDPGIRFTGITFNAFDNDNSMLTFDELALRDCTVEKAAELVQEKCREWSIKPIYVVDPSARNRSLVNAETVASEYARFNIHCQYGQNDVEAGVFQLKRRLQAKTVLITSNCVRLIWEVGRYRIKETPDGSFAVVKTDDHCIDSWRYSAMYRPFLAGPEREPSAWHFDGKTAPAAGHWLRPDNEHNPMF